jgi:ubiquinone/menaquinone biosynthesis C-methylase UbiE
VSPATEPHAGAARDHYSYAHYASRDVAEAFDALRFGGPVGRYLLRCQEALLAEALSPAGGRTVLDVGTGTGRAAIGLAAAGASVIGVDASVEMLRVARAKAAGAAVTMRVGIADAHALPFASQSVDAVVCLRVLMHAVDWRACVGELCRVAKWRVVVDFPSSASAAAIESRARRLARSMGRAVEAYRVLSERDVLDAFRQHGFRPVIVRRQFVLPIACHKAVGRLGFTRAIERVLASLGLLRLAGSPVTLVAER